MFFCIKNTLEIFEGILSIKSWSLVTRGPFWGAPVSPLTVVFSRIEKLDRPILLLGLAQHVAAVDLEVGFLPGVKLGFELEQNGGIDSGLERLATDDAEVTKSVPVAPLDAKSLWGVVILPCQVKRARLEAVVTVNVPGDDSLAGHDIPDIESALPG